MLNEAKEQLTKRKGFKGSIKISKIDPLERVCSTNDSNYINQEIDFAYLKAINIPFDSDLKQTGIEGDNKSLFLDYCDMTTF